MMTFAEGPWDDHIGHLLHMPGHIHIRCVWVSLRDPFNATASSPSTLVGSADVGRIVQHSPLQLLACDPGLGGGRML